MSNYLFSKNQYNPLIREQRINQTTLGYRIYSPSATIPYYAINYPYRSNIRRYSVSMLPAPLMPRVPAVQIVPIKTVPAVQPIQTVPSDQSLEMILIAILLLVSLDVIFTRPVKRGK